MKHLRFLSTKIKTKQYLIIILYAVLGGVISYYVDFSSMMRLCFYVVLFVIITTIKWYNYSDK